MWRMIPGVAGSARRARCGDRRVSRRQRSGADGSGESRSRGESDRRDGRRPSRRPNARPSGWARRLRTSAIGEPVRSVTLSAPSWVEAANGVPAHCRVNGSMAPIDTASTARPINFSVVLPASWSRRAAQLGGGGMNGIVPNLTGGGPGAQGPSLLDRGFATYGSDSGHQAAFGARARRAVRLPRRSQLRRTTGRSTRRRSRTSATCR